jgi:hypothetical protein
LDLVHELIVELSQLSVLKRELLELLQGLVLHMLQIRVLFDQVNSFLEQILNLRLQGILELL